MAVMTGRRTFRVCRARYARLDGTGAQLAGGRWNSPGRAVVYMAESIALAVVGESGAYDQTGLPARVVFVWPLYSPLE